MTSCTHAIPRAFATANAVINYATNPYPVASSTSTQPLAMAEVGICSCTLVANADALPAGDETLCPPRLTIAAENMSMSDMDVEGQPSNERKRFWLPTASGITPGVDC